MQFSPDKPTATFKVAPSGVAIATAFVVISGLLLAGGPNDYAGPHTILDTAVFLLSGLLAWQSWDLGSRLNRIFPKWLAVAFAITCLLEIIHSLITVDFIGALEPIERMAKAIRPITWPPAAYILPLGIGLGLWMRWRRSRRMKLGVLALCSLAVISSFVFRLFPDYSPPGWFGITRPTLMLVPILWIAVGVACWRFRALDRKLPTVALMAAVLCLGHVAMLYSVAPHDTLAVIAHLGKASGYLILLVALMQMASSDMQQLIRAEDALRQLAVRADEANAAKSRFLAMMSHELRTPMTGVLGMSDLLLSSNLTAEQEKFTRTLARSARTLLGLLNDVLDFSKIEAGQMQIENTAFLMSTTLGDMRDLFAGMASEKGILLEVKMPPVFQDAVVGDVTRIRQVLSNLISNALKFTAKGRITVRLQQDVLPGGALMVGFSVIDTGIGIAQEKIDKLFQPFAQADVSITRKFGGTGLGLAISRSLVRAMGGEIEVVSKEGAGATFTFFVRMEPDASEAAAERAKRGTRADGAAAAAADRDRRKALKVLVAEDNETTRMLISTMLTRTGHAVVAVEDGAKAVAAVKAGTYDIVLMDMQMPVMDGPDAMVAIRRLESESSARLPIIALTADARLEGKTTYLAAGADAVASKPIDWDALFAEMARLAASGTAPAAAPSASGAQAAHDVISAGVLAALERQLGADAFGKLLTSFTEELSALRREIATAIDTGALHEAKRVAHTLKGVCDSFGAFRAGEWARLIERDAKTIEDAATTLPALLAAIDAAQEVMTKEYFTTSADRGRP